MLTKKKQNNGSKNTQSRLALSKYLTSPKAPEKLEDCLHWLSNQAWIDQQVIIQALDQMIAELQQALDKRALLSVPAEKERVGLITIDPIQYMGRFATTYKNIFQELAKSHFFQSPYPKAEVLQQKLNDALSTIKILEKEFAQLKNTSGIHLMDSSEDQDRLMTTIHCAKHYLQLMGMMLTRIDKGMKKSMPGISFKDLSIHGVNLYALSLEQGREINHFYHSQAPEDLLNKFKHFVPYLKHFNKVERDLWQKINTNCLMLVAKEKPEIKALFVDFCTQYGAEACFSVYFREFIKDIGAELNAQSPYQLDALRERVDRLLLSSHAKAHYQAYDQLLLAKARIIWAQMYYVEKDEEIFSLHEKLYQSLFSIKDVNHLSAYDQVFMAEQFSYLNPDSELAKKYCPQTEGLREKTLDLLYPVLKDRQGLDDHLIEYANALFKTLAPQPKHKLPKDAIIDVDEIDDYYYKALESVYSQVKEKFLAKVQVLSLEQPDSRQTKAYNHPEEFSPAALSRLSGVLSTENASRRMSNYLSNIPDDALARPRQVLSRLNSLAGGTAIKQNQNYRSVVKNLEYMEQLNKRMNNLKESEEDFNPWV